MLFVLIIGQGLYNFENRTFLTMYHMIPDFGVRLVGWTRFGKGAQVAEERGENIRFSRQEG